MPANAIVDHAIVDALHALLEGTPTVHIVGELSHEAGERLGRSLPGGLSTAERSPQSPARHKVVVVLDPERLDEALGVVSSEGALAVAAINPGYGAFLVEVLDGARPPCRTSADLEGVCDRLERDGWAVEDATPVAVPLALIPFNPARIPKTVLAYLYARHPAIETYCFLVRARRAGARPGRPRPAGPPPANFPTLPWKSEAEWREEARPPATALAPGQPPPSPEVVVRVDEEAVHALEDARSMLEALRQALMRSEEELSRIKSSLTWRAIVKYRTARERLLPPHTRRGRLYDRVRSAIRRLALSSG